MEKLGVNNRAGVRVTGQGSRDRVMTQVSRLNLRKRLRGLLARHQPETRRAGHSLYSIRLEAAAVCDGNQLPYLLYAGLRPGTPSPRMQLHG